MKRVIEDTHLSNIGDALRETLGEDSHFLVEDMPEAVRYAVQESSNSGFEDGKKEGYQNGVKAGYENGYAEGFADGDELGYQAGWEQGAEEGYATGKAEGIEEGKELGYDEFWDAFQDYGNRTDYQVAFSRGFPNEAYNPKYDLQGNVNSVFAMGKITNAKVRILNATDITQMGRYNSVLTRIPELNMTETTVIGSDNNPFLGATKLTDLIMTGVLAKSMIFSSCPLSVTSLKSIISCMKDYSGTENEYTCTITFKTSSFSKLEAEGATAAYNGTPCTWAELIGFKKWNLAKG